MEEDPLKDKEYVDFLKADYVKYKKVKELKSKLVGMADDLASMNKDDFKKKYGNPSKAWADIKWELYKAQHGIE